MKRISKAAALFAVTIVFSSAANAVFLETAKLQYRVLEVKEFDGDRSFVWCETQPDEFEGETGTWGAESLSYNRSAKTLSFNGWNVPVKEKMYKEGVVVHLTFSASRSFPRKRVSVRKVEETGEIESIFSVKSESIRGRYLSTTENSLVLTYTESVSTVGSGGTVEGAKATCFSKTSVSQNAAEPPPSRPWYRDALDLLREYWPETCEGKRCTTKPVVFGIRG